MKKVLLVVLILLIVACTPQVTVTPEVTATSIPQTETAVPTATRDLEKELRADVIAQIQADPNYQSSYVQAFEEISGQSISEICADFAFKLGALDENLADFTFGINQYGICYVKSDDGSQIIFDKWDANGPLYVTPPTDSETDLEEENLLTSNPEVIASMASDILAEKTEFPSDVNPEQYSALVKEMNAQRGSKPVYVEAVDASGNPTVMYYNTETRQMETLKGTYEDNKEIIGQHGFDIYVEIGRNEQGLTTYIHPDTGEEIVVENSGDIDWDWVGDKNNASENISQEALASQILSSVLDGGYNAIQVITINKEPAEMVFAQGRYFGYNCIETIVIRDGIGIRTFVGAEGGLDLVDENTGKEKALGRLNGTSQRKSIKENMVYYIFVYNDQAGSWKSGRKDINQLENVIEPTRSYSELVDGYSTDGIVIIRSSAIVLRTDK